MLVINKFTKRVMGRSMLAKKLIINLKKKSFRKYIRNRKNLKN